MVSGDIEPPPSPLHDLGVIPSRVSLAISPNLDALLQHDDRIRGNFSSRSPTLGPSMISLPPPPRGHRKTLSHPQTPPEGQRSTETLQSQSTRSTSPQASLNPFINS